MESQYTGDLDIWIDISHQNAAKMMSVVNDFGFGSIGFNVEDFTKPNLINQIGYPPLRIDILTSIDGVSFSEAYAEKLEIELAEDLKVNYIGLNELIKNKNSSGRKIDLADIDALKRQVKKPRK